VLDQNYIVLSIVPWQKAVKLMVKGKAEAVNDGKVIAEIPYASGKFVIPSVIRLLCAIPWRAHAKHSRFSRKGVMIRDNFQCQYCGIKLGHNATIDHIIPVSRDGVSDYMNCVAACSDCNNKKANRTPFEAEMMLRNKPRNPTFLTANRTLLNGVPEEWRIYVMGVGYED
jgi:5-methylcytosine-specific restriction endonuclease McrA